MSIQIEICKPAPGIAFLEDEEPPKEACGTPSFKLSDYPINQPTLLKDGHCIFGESEMVLVAVTSTEPRHIRVSFIDPQGKVFLAFKAHSNYAWGVAGRFTSRSGYASIDEIVHPGKYRVLIETCTENREVEYEVT